MSSAPTDLAGASQSRQAQPQGRGVSRGQGRRMSPSAIKTSGYLVSCASVGLLGVAAYPGAEKAGLLPALFAGMASSVLGMGLRWLSYQVERRRGG